MIFKKSKNTTKPYLPTSEEFFVQKYFDYQMIKYKAEYMIPKLYGDEKSYRKVDFYLPKYDVYVEYFGMYNSTKAIRESYDEKVRVYLKNNLPTVILYPHELGFLDYAFHNKILKVLRLSKFKSRSKIFKYKLNRYLSIGKGYYLFLALLTYILFNGFIHTEESNLDGSDVLFTLFLGISSIILFMNFVFKILEVFFWDE